MTETNYDNRRHHCDQSRPSDARETGWLLERNREQGPEWALFGEFAIEWTKDSSKACRFARREDAEQLLAHGNDSDAVTEHTWDER